jgi:hypothetical protein
VTSGRKLVQDALREPLSAGGWTPRAAGWFTLALDLSKLAVVSVATASEHAPPASATATLHVHLRDDEVERLVSQLCGSRDDGYRTTTTTTSIGYLMPVQAWKEWDVIAGSAERVAAEMAAAVREHAEPYVRRLASDASATLEAVKASPAYPTAVGLGRAVVILRRAGEAAAARSLIEERLGALGARSDAAAVHEHGRADALRAWLGRS